MTEIKKRNRAIIKMKLAGVKYSFIAKEYPMSKQNVCRIWRTYLARIGAN